MASDKNKNRETVPTSNAPQDAVVAEFHRPEGLISLTKRYAQYDPGIDVRDRRNLGLSGAPLHGLLIGTRELPATIADPQTGEMRPWRVLVIELLQAAPVREAGSNPQEDKKRIAMPPEHIIISSTMAIDSMRERFGLDQAIEHPEMTFEVYLEPKADTARKSGYSLWTFPVFEMGKPRRRTAIQQINPFSELLKGQLASGQPVRGALSAGGVAGGAGGNVVERSADPV